MTQNCKQHTGIHSTPTLGAYTSLVSHKTVEKYNQKVLLLKTVSTIWINGMEIMHIWIYCPWIKSFLHLAIASHTYLDQMKDVIFIQEYENLDLILSLTK